LSYLDGIETQEVIGIRFV